MNNFTGCKDLLAQLDTLKNLAGDFSAREEQLNTTLRVESAKERDAFETQEHEQIADASVRMAAEEDGFAAAKDRLQSWFERRQARINRAYNGVRERMLADVSAQDDDCKRQAQQDLMAAEQRRDAELAQTAAAHENFQQRLAEATAAFQLLEKSVRGAFGGYGKFRRLLKARHQPADFPGGGNESLDELQRVSDKLNGNLARFKKFPLPQFFRFVPSGWRAHCCWALRVSGIRCCGILASRHHFRTFAVIALAGLAVVLVIYLFGLRAAASARQNYCRRFCSRAKFAASRFGKGGGGYQSELERIEQEFQQRITETQPSMETRDEGNRPPPLQPPDGIGRPGCAAQGKERILPSLATATAPIGA